MKKNIVLLLLAITFQGFAQTYPITNIIISLPANPDANIAEWSKAIPPLMISAQTRMEYGKVSPIVLESSILVSIKGNGAVCGSYTKANAPASNFNSPAKVWSGETALNLLGKACVLKPGNYELCVKFYGEGAAGKVVIGEACKSFTIKETEHLTYQPPQLLAPANGTILNDDGNLKKPMTFRWTPVIPRPQEPVTYRIRVWQLMEGQNRAQAIIQQPILGNDVGNLTQTTISNLITGPCKPPYLCNFVWNVQALNREGKPIGGNNGVSETYSLIVQPVNDAPSIIDLVFPANGSTISAKDKQKFTWTFKGLENNYSSGSNQLYKIKIVEIKGDQSPEEALRTNKPHFEKDSLKEVSFQYPSSAPSFIAGKKYGWDVSIFDRWGNLQRSEASMFFASSCDVNLILKLKSVECLAATHGNNNYKICMSATYNSSAYNLTYANAGSGFKAYNPSFTLFYGISNITPALQVQNNGTTTTVNYCFDVIVPPGQTSIKVGLQGDDKDPGPIVCQPGAELDLRLPDCTNLTCDCGKWNPLTVETAAGAKRYDCGNERPIELSCNKPVSFSNTYQCSPNDKTCQAKTKWEVTKDGESFSLGNGSSGTFTPTGNGTYILTTYANCNGKVCEPCITTFVIRDCDEKPCDCGEWSDFPIKVQTGGAIISRIKCNGSSSLGIGAYSIQYPNFICNPNDKTCLASYSWSVQGPVTGNGTGNLINFNFSLTGTYTITLTPICGNKKCKPCKIVIRIEDPLPCNISFTDNLKDNYCIGDLVTINWTGTPLPSTVNIVLIDFTNWIVYQTLATNIPNSGSYTLTFPANLPCDPERKWCFYVTDPAQIPQCWNYSKEFTVGCCVDEKPCDCGTWSPLSVQNATGTRRYDCGSTIEWTCEQALNFTANYQCSPNDKTCEAKTTWKLEKNGVLVKSGMGTNQLSDGFSLLENGTYNLTLNASCNGKICKPCTFKIVVKDCADDKGLYNGTSINKNKYADDIHYPDDMRSKIQLLSPKNGEKLKTDNPIFTWKNSKVTNDREKYRLKIVEIIGDQSPEQSMQKNDSFFDIFIESDLKATNGKDLFYQYPTAAPKFKPGNKYAWTIIIDGSYYEISIFDRWGEY